MSLHSSRRSGVFVACCLGLAALAEAGGCRELEPRAAEDAGTEGTSSSASSSGQGGSSSSSSGQTDAAASSSSSGSSGASSGSPPPFDGGPILPAGDHVIGPNDRPGTLTVPTGYDGEPMPLVLLLHGTNESAASVETFLKFKPAANAQGFFLLRASAKPNAFGAPAWNADHACCSYLASPPDDSTYLAELIRQAGHAVAVDSKRVYVVGHSSGGFMAYRLACDHSTLIAGIVSLAGAADADTTCTLQSPVHVLQVHGTSDGYVAYGGGMFGPGYSFPGAKASVAMWAGYDGCASTPAAAGSRTLLATDDTAVTAHGDCRAGGAAELWTLAGGTHQPAFTETFAVQVGEWLLARPKP